MLKITRDEEGLLEIRDAFGGNHPPLLTVLPFEAKQLRDELLKLYPLTTAAAKRYEVGCSDNGVIVPMWVTTKEVKETETRESIGYTYCVEDAERIVAALNSRED